MAEGNTDPATRIAALRSPERLRARAEVLQRPSPVPPHPGIYGWHFAQPPADGLDADRLLYVGIAPRHIRGPHQHTAATQANPLRLPRLG